MRLPSLVRITLSSLAAASSVVPAGAQPAAFSSPLIPLVEAAVPQPPPGYREWWRNGGPRIRTSDTQSALVLRLGLERSAILRELADEIEGGDVIVYVVASKELPSRLAGSLSVVARAGGYRYLRVLLNATLPAEHIIASLAHELQHVREVMAHPDVDDGASLSTLYRQIGRESRIAGRTGWETDAAHAIGVDVRRELSAGEAAILARRYNAVRRAGQ